MKQKSSFLKRIGFKIYFQLSIAILFLLWFLMPHIGCQEMINTAEPIVIDGVSEPRVIFLEHPQDQTAAEGEEVTFSSKFIAPSGSTVQWEESTDGGQTWHPVTKGKVSNDGGITWTEVGS